MLRRICGLLCAAALLAIPAAPTTAQRAAFIEELVVGGVDSPTALAFTPGGGMLVASKGGRLYLVEGGELRQPPVLDIAARLCTQSERGLLGVAVDPQFAQNGFIYVYYTARRNNACTTNNRSTDPFNRVSRFTLANGAAAAERILIDGIPSPNGNHNAGDLHFGKDGYLYISVGDGGRDYGGGSAGANDAARDRHTLLGKILRITRDGGIPPGNPFTTSANSGRCYDPAPGGNRSGSTTPGKFCRETFAWGLRNPFRIAFDPAAPTTRFFINDVGQNRSEEIDEGIAGADYGWNCFEATLPLNTQGPCASDPPQSPAAPIFEYRHADVAPPGQPDFLTGCESITGGAFVPPGVWPARYAGAYIFGDYVCARIFALIPEGGRYVPTLLVDEGRPPTHMAFGPYGGSQALYYTDYFAGEVRRVRYTVEANRPPVAALAAAPPGGEAPLQVAFSAAGSSDSDPGDAIVAYLWEFGDGATAETTGATTTHTYRAPGSYTARVRARDSFGALSAPASLLIDAGNGPPVPRIEAPAPGGRFSVGETITLRGGATDPQDGAVPGSRLFWEVRQRHDTHFHPYHQDSGASTTLVAPAPEDLAAVENSYLEVRLTATDSLGRSATVIRELRPRLVRLTFQTSPPGLQVRVDGGTSGNTLTGPANLRSWPGYDLQLGVPAGQTLNGAPMRFCRWSQGGPASQTLTTPPADAAYTAIFAPAAEGCPGAATPTATATPPTTATATSTPSPTRTTQATPAPAPARLYLPLLRR